MMTMRLLLVEDDLMIGKSLQQGLKQDGYAVDWVRDGQAAKLALQGGAYALLLLDLGLPRLTGRELLADLRRQKNQIPVLIITARDSIAERVEGLDSGADDYLVKPFAFEELAARIRALLRRNRSESSGVLTIGTLEIDPDRRTVNRGGQRIELTAREYELLEYLARNHDRVVSREMLARDVWKETSRATPLDNVIDVHVARLRRKIDDPFPVKLLHTVRGVGFTISQEQP